MYWGPPRATPDLSSVVLQVLHARQLGINCIVVLEQYAELGTLLAAAAALGVRPAIGVRARLSTHHGGCAQHLTWRSLAA